MVAVKSAQRRRSSTFQQRNSINILCGKLARAGTIAFIIQGLYAGPVQAEVQEEQHAEPVQDEVQGEYYAGTVQDEVREEHQFNLDITVNRNWVSGPGADQSWLSTERPYVGTDFSYNFQRIKGDKRFVFGFHGRGTDDKTVDRQTWSLNSLNLGWSDPNTNFRLGDVMAAFSNYSLYSSLKGVSLELTPGSGQNGPGGQPQVNLVYGISYPRWENFWGGENLKAIKRQIYGLNVRQPLGAKADIGLSVVRTNDSGRLASWDELYWNNIYALNWEYRPEDRMTLKGESAYSHTTKSPSDSEADQRLHGYAHQFSLNQSIKHQKWLYEYEIVSPDFTTLLGAAITDRERMKLKWSSALNPDVSVHAGLAWAQDNLPGSTRPYRTTLIQPELYFSFISPFKRDAASLDLGLRLDRRYNIGESTADRTATLNYRDTFGRIDADIMVDYQFYDTSPYDYGLKNRDLAFNITLGSSVNRESYILRPTLTFGYTRNTDLLNHYRDRMIEASVGLGYQRLRDNFSVNFRIGKNQNLKEVTPDSSRWFGHLRMEGQPKYLKALSANARQFLEVNINTYKFDDAGNNYRETGVISGIHLEF